MAWLDIGLRVSNLRENPAEIRAKKCRSDREGTERQ
jgi:hypothetical protein